MARPKTTEPAWYVEAKKHIGLKEIPGPKHNQTIIGWAKRLGAKTLGITVTDDETPWCGTFVAHCIDWVGLEPAKIAVRASSWAAWGRQLNGPRLGCILVFTRSGGGHVGFYVGEDNTHYHVLGGNQSNMVNVMRIAKSRLAVGGMRWPHGPALPPMKQIFRDPTKVAISTNEG